MAEVNDLVVRGSATVSSMKVVGNTNLLGNTNLEGETTVNNIKINDMTITNTDTIKYLMNFVYPVGSYFITENSEKFGSIDDVEKYFGGTWAQVEGGRFLEAYTGTINDSVRHVDAGLPNIKGDFAVKRFEDGENFPVWANTIATNAFYDALNHGSSSRPNVEGTKSGSAYAYRSVMFDASRYSNKYGKSSTVQPQARRVYIYYRITEFEG